MDSSSRDEGSLIEIDTAEDWKRIRNNVTEAINTVLDAELGKSASKASREALLQHLYQVRPTWIICSPVQDSKAESGKMKHWNTLGPTCASMVSNPSKRMMMRVRYFIIPFEMCGSSFVRLIAMEPYDEALNFTVWGMDNERLAYDDAVSEKRRIIPQQVRDLIEGILNHERSTVFQVLGRDAQDDLSMDVELTHS